MVDKNDEESKKNFHNGTKIEFLMNDILQYILKKNGIKRRYDWKVHVSKENKLNAVSYPGGNIIFYEPVFAAFENLE